MPRFDRELWRKRAQERAGRRQASSLPQDLAAVESIARAVDWCRRSGIDVAFDYRTGGTSSGDSVTVNSRLAPERQLHVLLHEVGHCLVRRRLLESRFRRGYEERDPARLRSTAHRIDVLFEELEAWHEGLRAAAMAGVDVDLDRYNRTRSEYVRGYLKWALRAPGYEGGLEDDDPGPGKRRQAASRR